MFGSGLNFIHKFVSVLPQLASRSPKPGGAAAAKWQVPPLKTVHDARLSLWQSSARAAAHAQMIHAAVPINEGTLYNHPMVRAATEHARLGSVKSTDLPEPGTPAFARLQLEEQRPAILVAGDQEHPDPVYLSSLFFE